jgi:hypothetical protein
MLLFPRPSCPLEFFPQIYSSPSTTRNGKEECTHLQGIVIKEKQTQEKYD